MVLNGAHGIYDVNTDNGILRCTLRGKLKKAFAEAQSAKAAGKMRPRYDKMSPSTRSRRRDQDSHAAALPVRLTVGDYVKLRQIDHKHGWIEEILPRQSALSRKDADSKANRSIEQTMLANLDQVVLV